MEILLVNRNFTLDEDIIGPVLAVIVGIEFILSLATNLFVLLFTLTHCKTLKQPSIIFLDNFVIANLLMTLLVMPFTITTASVGEWVFGRNLEQKDRTCHFQGFVFAYVIQLSTLTLATISIDRFLFIVKPFFYKRVMKTWVAFLVVIFIWILAGLINIPPYFGLGQYAFGNTIATCAQVWVVDQKDFIVYFCLISLVVTVVITVTTLWTFCFTRRFIKRTHFTSSSPKDINNKQIAQKNLYTRRIVKLIGIFSLLLITTTVTFVPAVIAGIASLIIGSENLPAPILPVAIIMFFVNSIVNPVIQAYFRKDMNEFIVHTWQKMLKCCVQRKLQGDTPFTSQSGQIATQLSSVA